MLKNVLVIVFGFCKCCSRYSRPSTGTFPAAHFRVLVVILEEGHVHAGILHTVTLVPGDAPPVEHLAHASSSRFVSHHFHYPRIISFTRESFSTASPRHVLRVTHFRRFLSTWFYSYTRRNTCSTRRVFDENRHAHIFDVSESIFSERSSFSKLAIVVRQLTRTQRSKTSVDMDRSIRYP